MLNVFISRNCLESVLSTLIFTNREPPVYKDHFWEVRQMINEWNSNMGLKFSHSWIACLDRSMRKWVDKFTYSTSYNAPRNA